MSLFPPFRLSLPVGHESLRLVLVWGCAVVLALAGCR